MAAERREGSSSSTQRAAVVADELVARMARDLVFVPRFLGESQERLRHHFRAFATSEISRNGMTVEQYPILSAFLDKHAGLLCEFVFTGVSLAHQLPMAEVEQLLGDQAGLLRGDIWDQLKIHIAMAEQKFRADIPQLSEQLRRLQPEWPDDEKEKR